jgi:potassium-dependent mechanosensitive channel
MLRRLALVLVLLLGSTLPVFWQGAGLVGAALAQSDPAPDYAAWEKDAAAAESLIQAERIANTALDEMRAKIVAWRATFLAAQSANSSQIQTVRNQISALGPAPAKEETEAPDIAARRAELTDQLSKLQAPGIKAVEAYSRADGLIRQIDTKIRARQATELLKLSPTPLNPINWPAGWAVLQQGVKTLWAESVDAWNDPARRTLMKNNLPAILAVLALAGLLLIKGPQFMERVTSRLQTGASVRGRTLVAALVSVGQVLVPVLGMMLLVVAIGLSGMTGTRSSALIAALPDAAFVFFAARWISGWIFGTAATMGVAKSNLEARFHITIIGLILALDVFRRAFTTEVRPPLSLAAQSVWAAPLVCVVSIFLFRLGQILRGLGKDETVTKDAAAFRKSMITLIGSALMLVSVLGPLLAVIGYVNAANAIVWPAVHSIALLGVMILVQRFATDIYVMVTGSGEEGREALIPVLIGALLTLLSLPVLALMWGARFADLSEIWTRFSEGFPIGQTRISPAIFVTLLLVFALGYMATRLAQGALKSSILPRTRLDKGAQNALAAGVGYLGIFLSVLAAITTAGIDLSALAYVAGALSVGIGFGLQNIVQNFVSGIILLIERPISEGDMIEVNGQFGVVKGISVRSTWIETFDKTDVIVPNADLISGVVTNLTRGNLTGRLIIPVGVAYGSDTRAVEAILQEIAEAQPLVLVNPPPNVFFVGFGADSLNFEIRAILSDVNFKMVAQTEILHQITERFVAAGIEIPFAQRDIWLRNPEALTAPARRATAPEVVAPASSEAPKAPPADPSQINNDPSEGEEES